MRFYARDSDGRQISATPDLLDGTVAGGRSRFSMKLAESNPFAKTFAVTEGFLPPDRHLKRFFEIVNLERGLVVAGIALLAGGALLLAAIRQWWLTGFGHLDYTYTMRFVVPGATLVALGFQTVFSSFFVSILGMRRK